MPNIMTIMMTFIQILLPFKASRLYACPCSKLPLHLKFEYIWYLFLQRNVKNDDSKVVKKEPNMNFSNSRLRLKFGNDRPVIVITQNTKTKTICSNDCINNGERKCKVFIFLLFQFHSVRGRLNVIQCRDLGEKCCKFYYFFFL